MFSQLVLGLFVSVMTQAVESLSNDDGDAWKKMKLHILPAKFATVKICSARQWLLKRAQAKYAMTAFNSKWKNEKLAVVVRVPQTTHNLVISPFCFVEDGKGMYKEL